MSELKIFNKEIYERLRDIVGDSDRYEYKVIMCANSLHLYNEVAKKLNGKLEDAIVEYGEKKGSNITALYNIYDKEYGKFSEASRRLGLDPESAKKLGLKEYRPKFDLELKRA